MLRAADGATAIRASDAERERVTSTLEREFAAGRLRTAELEQRIAAAQGARTREQLRALIADLPAEPAHPVPVATVPHHCLVCLLFCFCPPAGLVYWLMHWHANRTDAPR